MRKFLFLLSLSAAAVSAANIYSTGFEGPTYSLGTLSGQDGWGGGLLPAVQNTVFNSGAQAVGASGSQQSYTTRGVSYNSIGNPDQTVDVQVDFYLDPNASGQIFTIVGYSATTGFMGQIVVFSSGVMQIGNVGGFTGNQNLSKGVWHTVRSSLNFGTQTASGYLDGVFFGSIALDPSATPTDLVSVGLGINNASQGQTGGAYWDNLSVTSTGASAGAVPEPGTLTLLGLGIAAILVGKSLRR